MSGKPPITRHPLFPATVALWFGALFGIGSLAMRPALIDSAILALNLDAIIAVPIGPTARILIALALAGAGGLLGARLARRIARPKPVARPRKRGADLTARGAASPAQPAPPETPASPMVRGARRTQLAIPDDGHGTVEYYDRAPVPGSAQILDVSQFGLEGFEPEKEQTANQETAQAPELTLPTGDEHTGPEHTGEAAFLPGPAYDVVPARVPETPFEPAAAQTEAETPPASPVLPRFTGEDDSADPATNTPVEAAPRALFGHAPTAPGLFTQPFNAKVSEIRWQDDSAQGEQSPERRDAPTDQPPPPEAPHDSDASAADRIASARLDDLAPIELLERLAISLREKRGRAALAADPRPLASGPDTPAARDENQPAAEMTVDHTAEPDLEDEAEETEPFASAPVAPPVPTIPAGLRPIGLDPEDDEDHLPGYIPPRRIGGAGQAYSAPAAPPVTPSADPETDEAATTDSLDLEGGYSSLLNLSRSASLAQGAGQRFVRIEEPEPLTGEIEPVVVFPNQMIDTPDSPREAGGEETRSGDSGDSSAADSPANGRDSEETERALRSALANIQRMSGAA